MFLQRLSTWERFRNYTQSFWWHRCTFVSKNIPLTTGSSRMWLWFGPIAARDSTGRAASCFRSCSNCRCVIFEGKLLSSVDLLMWETFHDSHPCFLLQPPATSNLWSHQHHLNYILLKNIQFQTTANTNWSSVGPSNKRVNWFGATGLQILRLQSLEGRKITVKCSQSTFLWVSL